MRSLTHICQTHYILKRLGEGLHAVVYAIISKKYADNFIADLPPETFKSTALDDLRKATIAVKIANGPLSGSATAAVAMRHEISVLKVLGGGRMLAHDEKEVLWYTMPLVSGGTLRSFIEHLHRAIMSF